MLLPLKAMVAGSLSTGSGPAVWDETRQL